MKDKRREEILKKVSKALQRRRDIGMKNRLGVANPKPARVTRVIPEDRPHHLYRTNSMFLSGSIGDAIAVESFLSDQERSLISKIYYATQKKSEIEMILKSLPNMSSVQDHAVAWDDFSDLWCFFSKDDCIKKMRSARRPIPADLVRAEDFSISPKFRQFLDGDIAYNESSLLKYNLANISKFTLPDLYFVVCPYSTDKRIKNRDFDKGDWDECIAWIKKLGLQAVVLNVGQEIIPDCAELINLSNQTTITEAIEILKGASGYIGIDSSMSVVAAKLFSGQSLQIKSVNEHCYRYAKCYYAPHTDFPFLVNSIKTPDGVKQFVPPAANVKSITLNVCQGVGDIFWVYQKFAPHFEEIHFCITHVMSGAKKVQHRANDFLRLMPKVNKVSFRVVSSEIYNKLAASRFSMEEIMKAYDKGQRTFDYACNLPLEEGIRIEDIDPAYPVEETVDIHSEPFRTDLKNCLTVYVSGSTMQPENVSRLKLWSPKMWSMFVDGFCKKYNLEKSVVLIGASYDLEATQLTASALGDLGYETRIITDSKPANVVDILKNSKAFVGYQSGLNILADNLDVKQVMIYFPYLKDMLYTWCKKKNIETTFAASTFDKSPEEVLNDLKLTI